MAKKGKGKTYLVGGIIVVIALVVLLVDFDNIGEIQTLTGVDDLTFVIPVPNSLVPNSLLPPSDDFDPFLPPTNFVLGGVECKIKHELKVYDVNGKLSRTEQSRGIQGSPQFQSVSSLVTPANVQVSHYTVVPKIFCEVQQGYPLLEIQPSNLTVEVYAQTNPASDQRVEVFSKNLRTGLYFFPSPPTQVAEPALGVVTIRASDIEPFFQNQDFNAQLEFRVFGTLNLGFDTSSGLLTQYEIPIGELQIRSYYVQPVRVDQCQDRDLDGICDEFDQCPDVPENFNNFQDQDGCPDTPDDIDPPEPPCSGSSCPITNQVDCNNKNQTWMINTGGTNDVCFGGALFTQGELCKVYDSAQSKCIDPAPTTTGGGTLGEDIETCDNLNGLYRQNPNNLLSTQLFTPTELSGKAVRTLDFGMCLVSSNPTGIGSPCTTSSCVVTDAKDGKITTLITITYSDGTTETTLSSDLSVFSQGFVTNQLFSTSGGQIKEISSVKYETFYTRDTLDLAQDQRFTGGGVQFNPVMTIDGFKIQIKPEPATGSDQGLSGHVLNQLTNKYGFSLGHRVLTAQSIEADIPDIFSGVKTISLNMAVDGIMTIQKDGVSGTVNVQGEQSTLTGITVDIDVKPEICRPPNVIDPITLKCNPPDLVCTPPLYKNAQGTACELIEDDEDYDSCHNEHSPPKEFVGNACVTIIVGQLGGEPCTDDHPAHFSFSCSPNYRALFCDAQNFCGIPVPPEQCTPPKIRVGDDCVNPPDICLDGQTNASHGCVERPNVSYCLSIGEFYEPSTNTCKEAPPNDCEDDLYASLFPELCPPVEPPINSCEAIGKVQDPITLTCYDECVANTTYDSQFGRCLVDCPSGQIRIFPNAQCNPAPDNDRDGDGFLNNVDACPDQYAPAFTGSTNGCPICVGAGCGGIVTPPIVLPPIINDPTFQLAIVALIIIIAVIMIIRRRNSY